MEKPTNKEMFDLLNKLSHHCDEKEVEMLYFIKGLIISNNIEESKPDSDNIISVGNTHFYPKN